MSSSHVCIDTCFNARNSTKMIVNCFLCERKFNAKCFGLGTELIINAISSPLKNVMFMCLKCLERVSKWKSSARRSTETAEAAASNEVSPSLSSVMSMLQSMSTDIAKIDRCNTELKDSLTHLNADRSNDEGAVRTYERLFATFHAKLDQGLADCKSSSRKDSETICRLLDNLQDKVPHSSGSRKPLTDSNSNRRSSINGHNVDPMNWSFSFNQSTLPNDNVELYQLLNGFEQNTWASFDNLSRKLDENSERVRNVERICLDASSASNKHQRMESPVSEAIKLDTIQVINDKCETIVEKVVAIESVVCNGRTRSVSDSLSTQDMRQRLHQLVTDGVNDNCLTPTSATDHDSSSNLLTERLLSCPTISNVDTIGGLVPRSNTINSAPSRTSLVAAIDKNWYHVSRLKLGTTEDMIVDFVHENLGICKSSIVVKSLIKRDLDPSTITFASFKVGFDPSCAIDMTELQSIWPTNVSCNVFIPKNLLNRRRRM